MTTGDMPAEDKIYKLTVRLPEDLGRQIRKVAIDYDKSLVDVTIEALREYIKRHPEKK